MDSGVRGWIWLLVLGSLVSTGGCNGAGHGAPATPRAPADAIPASVAITGVDTTIGEALGTMRSTVTVPDFRITREPITVARYKQCVEAGVCQPPAVTLGGCDRPNQGVDGATYETKANAASTPVTCVTARQAVTYCSWVGGELARVDQWMLAARGPDVHRFAWGDDDATCDRIWRTSFLASGPKACCGHDCRDTVAAALGAHGTAADRAADVLTTRSELVAPSNSVVLGCAPGVTACVVSGMDPGAIDQVVRARNVPEFGAASFRCTWTGDAR